MDCEGIEYDCEGIKHDIDYVIVVGIVMDHENNVMVRVGSSDPVECATAATCPLQQGSKHRQYSLLVPILSIILSSISNFLSLSLSSLSAALSSAFSQILATISANSSSPRLSLRPAQSIE